jgi:hypothetical protein
MVGAGVDAVSSQGFGGALGGDESCRKHVWRVLKLFIRDVSTTSKR